MKKIFLFVFLHYIRDKTQNKKIFSFCDFFVDVSVVGNCGGEKDTFQIAAFVLFLDHFKICCIKKFAKFWGNDGDIGTAFFQGGGASESNWTASRD